jgi:AhpC/TSA family
MITLLNEQRETKLPEAIASGDSLWLSRENIEQALGWSWKPEGLCRDDTCVPLPREQASSLVRGNKLDIAAMWSHMGQPVVHDAVADTWVFGVGAQERANALSELSAPDFALPDLDGQTHQLSNYRGKKVLLVTWASW